MATRYFLLRVQEKVPKENDTHGSARYAGTLRFSSHSGLFRRDLHVPTEEGRHPCRPLAGLFLAGSRCLTDPKGFRMASPYLLRRSRVPEPIQDKARRGATGMWRLQRGIGISLRWSPWSGEERRVPVGQVVECLFLSPISFRQVKEMGSQLTHRSKNKVSAYISCETDYRYDNTHSRGYRGPPRGRMNNSKVLRN